MNFSKLALGRRVAENVDPLEVAQRTRDNALTGGERQHQGTANLRQKQKQQASKKVTPSHSGVTYASEMRQIEIVKERARQESNWRQELAEAIEDNDQEAHPYVDVMPPVIKREKKMIAQAMQATKQKKSEVGVKDAVQEDTMQRLVDAGQKLAKERKDTPKIVDKTKPVVGTRYNKPTYVTDRK